MEYNTSLKKLILPEYGRNIQRLIEYCKTIENKEERNKMAEYIVYLMSGISAKNQVEQKHKIWYHFAMIAGFDIDVDFPIEKPVAEELEAKPKKMSYPVNNIKQRYYGRNIQSIIDKIVEMPESEERTILIRMTANHMKRLYIKWNRPQVNDEVIFEDMRKMSDNKIVIEEDLRLMHYNYNQPNNRDQKRPRRKFTKR